jgi:hypothetical protein
VLLPWNLIVDPHRADEDEAPHAGLVHGLHDALGLLFEIAGEVGVDDVLPSHGLLQLAGIEHVALDDAGTFGIDASQPARVAQVERELHIRFVQEELDRTTGDLAVCTEDQDVAHVRSSFVPT